MEPKDRFEEQTLDGSLIHLDLFGEPDAVSKLTFRSRGRNIVTMNNPSKDAISDAFAFLRNYAPLLDSETIQEDWKIYEKALQFTSDTTYNSFWNLKSEKEPRFDDKDNTKLEWIKTDSSGQEIKFYYLGCNMDQADVYLDSGIPVGTKLTLDEEYAKQQAFDACAKHPFSIEQARVLIVELPTKSVKDTITTVAIKASNITPTLA
ncbi:hypothetical protein L1D14_23000 [Vibrio tubiashii]|uniref:hypothetical protein n=1 Tax=Vibrio tubiashii TaxID=29498 RepID=UPI001EFD7778|nr:hypothetical protein [Vibrio tubiashii]MCG9579073.1 hypothetical protein [Vibrio tubiashii]